VDSYSIIIETENLGMADSAHLWACLESLQASIAKASPPEAVLLLNSGNLGQEMLVYLAGSFPAVRVVPVPAGYSYYEVKMHGARLVTSELIVFADSDCSYNEDWLPGLLESFSDPKVRVVAGETGFVAPGPYGLALAIAHSFDGYSDAAGLYPVKNYYANNVAMRRSLLLEVPIPANLPLYRHACSVHSDQLRRRGETIWAQPRSRAVHAATEGLSYFFWRFILFGRDRSVRARLQLEGGTQKEDVHSRSVLHTIKLRFERALRYGPWSWKSALPAGAIVCLAFLLIRAGQLLARFNPQIAIAHFGAIEGCRYPTVSEFLSVRGIGKNPGNGMSG
jgi:hypothetical protein